jgi:hypothetical protein
MGWGIERDCTKMSWAVLEGWRYLAFTTSMIREGVALTAIELALKLGGWAGNSDENK